MSRNDYVRFGISYTALSGFNAGAAVVFYILDKPNWITTTMAVVCAAASVIYFSQANKGN